MNKKSKVILLPCNSYREEIVYENLEIGLELLGGIENIVGKEESVLLKPNLLKKAEVDKAVITHPTVVGMFARLMREKGYQDMALADSCGNGTTSKVIHGTGMDTYLEKLDIPALNKGRIPEYLKANMLTARNITDRPVFAGCIGPYSLAGRLYDMSEIMMLIYINPEAANTLLRKCNDFITRYCMALKATGVNGVIMAEPAAGLLSNEDCLQYSSLFVKEIVEKVQDDHFAVVLHNCGNTGNCTQAMVYTGAAAYHFGNKIKMEEALKEVPTDALAMGNLDPVSLFKMAGPETMKEATLQLLEATRAYPNFVLSSGCDIPPLTPSANIDAFYAALEEFNNV